MIFNLLLTALVVNSSAFAQSPATCVDLSGTYLIDRGYLSVSGRSSGRSPVDFIQTACDEIQIIGNNLDLDYFTDGSQKISQTKSANGSTIDATTRAWINATTLTIHNFEEVTPKRQFLPTTATNTTLKIILSDPNTLTITKEVTWTDSRGASGHFVRAAIGTRIQ